MPFRALIVGAGIAGLGAAIALAKQGHHVTILEATCELRPIGGTITLQANANRCLDQLDVYEALLRFRNRISNGPTTRRHKDGKVLAQKPAKAHESTFGYPQWPIHRADLQQTLVDASRARGVTLRLGCPVINIERGCCGVAAVVKGGERIDADFVVAADGIESGIRRIIAQGVACVKDSGMDVTRAMIPEAAVLADPETATFMEHISLWCGPSTTIVAMAVWRGHEKFLGLDCYHKRVNCLADSISKRQDIAQFKKCFNAFAPAMQKILSLVKEAHVWKLKESLPSSWVSDDGNVVLIGDAAHGSLPYIGQGAGMALEDAVTLAQCLGRAMQNVEIPSVLKAFQEIRQGRCKRVQEWSAIKGSRATLEEGPEQRERDRCIMAANAWISSQAWDGVHIDQTPELEAPTWKAWLCGHDAKDYTNRKLDIFLPESRRQRRGSWNS